MNLSNFQFMKFCMVGVFNAVVDFMVYFTITRLLLGGPEFILTVKALSFLAASLSSFFLNRYFTFKKRDQWQFKELLRFYSTVGLGIFLNVGMQYVAVGVLHLHDLVGVVISSGATAVWSFLFLKFYVFKK